MSSKRSTTSGATRATPTEPRTSPPNQAIAFTLDPNVLHEVLVHALLDSRVTEGIANALSAHAPPRAEGTPRFMNTSEYAVRARISKRTLDYERQDMTEGVHFSRSGRRIRFHVKEADEFLALSKAQRRKGAASGAEPADLGELMKDEIKRRSIKARASEGALP